MAWTSEQRETGAMAFLNDEDRAAADFRMAAVRNVPGRALVLGVKGRPFSASVIKLDPQWSDGRKAFLDVALYWETPEELANAWRAGETLDARYVEVPFTKGWAHLVWAYVEDERRNCEKFLGDG